MSYFDRAIKLIGNLKLSFILLILLVLLIAQKAIIAQKEVLPTDGEEVPWLLKLLSSLGIASPDSLDNPFLFVMVLFVINLLFSSITMAQKVKIKQKSVRGYKDEDAIKALSNSAEFPAPENSETIIADYLKRNGLRLKLESTEAKTRLYAGKRESGRWGVLFFHLTFLIVLVGALMSILTRYSGYVELSPGEVFIEKHDNYLRVTKRPKLFGNDRMFSIQLKEIDLSYWKPGVIKQRASIVNVFDEKGSFIRMKRIQVNSPLKTGGTNIYQGSKHGFISELKIIDSEGNRAEGTARFLIPDKQGKRMISRVNLPGTGLGLELELFTEKLGKIQGLEQLGAHHMATLIKLTTVEGQRRIFQGVVFKGRSLSFEGLTLKFVSLKPYTSFVFVRDYGAPVIFAGFVFLLFGLITAYFWIPENYWALIKKQGIKEKIIIGGTTERYRESFKERFSEYISAMRKEMERS